MGTDGWTLPCALIMELEYYKREPHSWPVEIAIGPSRAPRKANGDANTIRKVTVDATSTCVDQLFVHPTHEHEYEWTISHERTGLMVMTGIPDERTVMVLAGAIGKLFAWGYEQGVDSHSGKKLQRRFKELPERVQKWIRMWGYQD